ncbi:alpha/beta hydrolase [Herbiconiux moechotypicola]|uniref:alpha/beta hydrolase n=1 Tax=Herbiconiux moechotypicola TaxID=637393 RepID=UPI00217CC39B|nr:alpha/beta hydrolase [Herbiconiux moechotypicola]MCS5729564.1 alpha/beta hydrolase [Herbiconiux moechotypicola]
MEIEAVLPELREPMKRAQAKAPRWLLRVAVRMLRVPRSEAVRVRTVKLATASVRVYEPVEAAGGGAAPTHAAAPALLWIHGGGLLFGDAKQDESLCLSTAERLGLVIVSANYRFAPEHPFPAAHDDVHAAWSWLVAHAGDLGVDPERLAIGGESAGAGLAAGLVQRLHDEGGVQPVAQWLFAPMIDDRTAADRSLDALDHFVWNNASNREGWSGYLGRAPGDPSDAAVPPYASPARRPDLTGLPPAFLSWADIELFAAEDGAYADRLRASGVEVHTDVVAGGVHGFENWAATTPVAQALITRAQTWLEGALARA